MHKILFTLRALTLAALAIVVIDAGEVIPEFYLIAIPVVATWAITELVRR